VNSSKGRWYWATNYKGSFELDPPRYFKTWYQAAADCEDYNRLRSFLVTFNEFSEQFKNLSQSMPPEAAFNQLWQEYR